MNKRDLFAGLSMKDIEEHQQTYSDEVRKLYGREIAEETEKRTSAYTSDDWRAIMAEFDSIYRRIAARMIHGPDDAEVQSAVGRSVIIFANIITIAHSTFSEGLEKCISLTNDLQIQSINMEKALPLFAGGDHHYCDQQEKPRL